MRVRRGIAERHVVGLVEAEIAEAFDDFHAGRFGQMTKGKAGDHNAD